MVANQPDSGKTKPAQTQDKQPGEESQMTPEPRFQPPPYRSADKLQGKVAVISGGDSGIGRSVAVHFAEEGADVAILYLDEHEDAEKTKGEIEDRGRRCLAIAGDIGDDGFCRAAVGKIVAEFGQIDVLVNNAAEQHPQKRLEDIDNEQLLRTFKTNIFSMFYLTRAALPHMKSGSTIVNSTSVTAYRGSHHLIDYASTKGAIVSFTRSLSQSLVKRGIRVNGVAPGPIWTPLIPSTFDEEKVASFGKDTPMGRAGQPSEVAPCYVFLASADASYMTGQVLHPNGGDFITT